MTMDSRDKQFQDDSMNHITATLAGEAQRLQSQINTGQLPASAGKGIALMAEANAIFAQILLGAEPESSDESSEEGDGDGDGE